MNTAGLHLQQHERGCHDREEQAAPLSMSGMQPLVSSTGRKRPREGQGSAQGHTAEDGRTSTRLQSPPRPPQVLPLKVCVSLLRCLAEQDTAHRRKPACPVTFKSCTHKHTDTDTHTHTETHTIHRNTHTNLQIKCMHIVPAKHTYKHICAYFRSCPEAYTLESLPVP